jgi:hypothetical protein
VLDEVQDKIVAPIPQQPEEEPQPELDRTPETSFSVGRCEVNPNSWASHIDNNPNDIDERDDYHTIGLASGYNEEGEPVFAAQARILGLGNNTYEITTADANGTDTTEVINLGEDMWAKALTGTDNWDGVVTGRISEEDGSVNFKINCLGDFGFHGEMNVTPLEDLPTVPEQEAPEEDPSLSV